MNWNGQIKDKRKKGIFSKNQKDFYPIWLSFEQEVIPSAVMEGIRLFLTDVRRPIVPSPILRSQLYDFQV